MKNPSYLSIFVIISLFLLACKSDDNDEPTLAEVQLNALRAHSWEVVTVVRGSEDVTVFYEGFTITFDGTLNKDKTNVEPGTYTTVNGGKTFTTPGTWYFDSTNIEEKMILDDRPTGYILEEANGKETLRLTFNYEGDDRGRLSGVAGDYIFDLVEATP